MANLGCTKLSFDAPTYYGIEEDEDEEGLVPTDSVPETLPGETRRRFLQWLTGDFELPEPDSLFKILPQLAFAGFRLPNTVIYNVLGETDTTKLSYIQKVLEGYGDELRLYFIAHGFLSHLNAGWMDEMQKNILRAQRESAVVVQIGWGRGCSSKLQYTAAIANMTDVGQAVGQVIVDLLAKLPETPVVIGIGHSLGAHLMARVSRHCKKKGIEFSRICGLDPSGVGLEDSIHQHLMLKSSDATFVDVIHTDGCCSRLWDYDHFDTPSEAEDRFNPVGYFGTMRPLGHLDFYPNGGHDQPGTKRGLTSFTTSHSFAHKYFNDSFSRRKDFVAKYKLGVQPEIMQKPKRRDLPLEVKPPVTMGFYCSPAPTGQFYIDMDALYP